MKRIISILLVAIFISFSATTVSAAYKTGKNYYKQYQTYKHKYEKAKKEIKELEKQRDDYGNQNESTYLDLVQCERLRSGDKPWEEWQKVANNKIKN